MFKGLHFAFSFITLFLISSHLFAQNSVPPNKIVYDHKVFWSKTEVNEIFKNKFGVGADFVYRRKNELGEGSMFSAPLRESFRPWVHYQFSPYSRLSFSPIGIMHTNEYIGKPEDYNRLSYKEWRSTVQFFHHLKQWNGRIMHTWRYRYEFRWQENPLLDNYRFLMRFRFRYRIRVMLNSSDFYENNTIYTAFSNEIGLNIGKNVVMNTFNQNRFYAGVGIRVANAFRVEARYVDRIRTRGSTGFEFDHGRGFMLGIYVDQISSLGKQKLQPVRLSN